MLLFLRHEANWANANEIKGERKHALTEGRQGPSGAKHPHVKRTRPNPTKDNPPDPPNQGPPPSHLPRTTTKTAKGSYLRCLFQFHLMFNMFLLQRTPLAPHSLCHDGLRILLRIRFVLYTHSISCDFLISSYFVHGHSIGSEEFCIGSGRIKNPPFQWHSSLR